MAEYRILGFNRSLQTEFFLFLLTTVKFNMPPKTVWPKLKGHTVPAKLHYDEKACSNKHNIVKWISLMNTS